MSAGQKRTHAETLQKYDVLINQVQSDYRGPIMYFNNETKELLGAKSLTVLGKLVDQRFQVRQSQRFKHLVDVVNGHKSEFDKKKIIKNQSPEGWKKVESGQLRKYRVYVFLENNVVPNNLHVGIFAHKFDDEYIMGCSVFCSEYESMSEVEKYRVAKFYRTTVFEAPADIQEAYMNFFEFDQDESYSQSQKLLYSLDKAAKANQQRAKELQAEGASENEIRKEVNENLDLDAGDVLDIVEDMREYLPEENVYAPQGGKKRRKNKRRTRKNKTRVTKTRRKGTKRRRY